MGNKLVIIEGAQGVGKGTVSSILREKMPYTNLLRLSGVEDIYGNSKTSLVRLNELQMIYKSAGCNLNYILDRSYLSEQVFCRLDLKPYDFDSETDMLNTMLDSLTNYYDVTVVVLTAYKREFEDRLRRNKPEYLGVKFDPNNSMKQQELYLEEVDKLTNRYPKIRSVVIDTSDRNPNTIADTIIKLI